MQFLPRLSFFFVEATRQNLGWKVWVEVALNKLLARFIIVIMADAWWGVCVVAMVIQKLWTMNTMTSCKEEIPFTSIGARINLELPFTRNGGRMKTELPFSRTMDSNIQTTCTYRLAGTTHHPIRTVSSFTLLTSSFAMSIITHPLKSREAVEDICGTGTVVGSTTPVPEALTRF